jgi:4-amino-4-deoxy-L-arabinose transferase-like glycosyltransferase
MRERLRKIFTSLSLILLVAFTARVAFAWSQARKIPDAALAVAPFAQETGGIAYALSTGKGFSNPFHKETGPTAWLTPVYPSLVAAAFKIFGAFTVHAFFALVFLNILFSTTVCIPIFFVGKRIVGVGLASAAAWLWTLFPNAIMVPFEWIWDTSLSALLCAVLLWATLELSDTPRPFHWCAYGILWGFALMTNPSLASLLPFLLAWAVYRAPRQAIHLRLSRPALALGVAVLCCVPWTIRNYVVFHRFVPLRSNFPLELYIGNNENYDEKHVRYPGPITKERELLRYFHMGEMPFMDEEMRKAKNFMIANPRMDVILFADKFVAFWTGLPHPVDAFLSTDSLLVQALLLCSTVSGLGALFGIGVLVRRRSPYTLPSAAFPVIFPLLYYLTHTSLRYRHPIDPVVLLLTAVAAQASMRWMSTWRVFRELSRLRRQAFTTGRSNRSCVARRSFHPEIAKTSQTARAFVRPWESSRRIPLRSRSNSLPRPLDRRSPVRS